MDTLYGWQKAVREGRLDAGPGSRTPETAMSLGEELAALRKKVKELYLYNIKMPASRKAACRHLFLNSCRRNHTARPEGCDYCGLATRKHMSLGSPSSKKL